MNIRFLDIVLLLLSLLLMMFVLCLHDELRTRRENSNRTTTTSSGTYRGKKGEEEHACTIHAQLYKKKTALFGSRLLCGASSVAGGVSDFGRKTRKGWNGRIQRGVGETAIIHNNIGITNVDVIRSTASSSTSSNSLVSSHKYENRSMSTCFFPGNFLSQSNIFRILNRPPPCVDYDTWYSLSVCCFPLCMGYVWPFLGGSYS